LGFEFTWGWILVNRRRGSSEVGIAAPIKVLIQRFSFLFLVFAAFGIMLLSKAETVVFDKVSTVVVDIFSPLLGALSEPAATVSIAINRVRELANLREENILLKRENERLLVWKEAATRLAAKNQSLQTLLNFKPEPNLRSITTRVIANSGGAFVRSVVVNAGESEGVRKGQAAVSGAGLAGRVASAGYQSARVLLITDINSRVPVLVGEHRDRAILAGDNSVMPRLTFLPVNAAVKLGDGVVTSGHGGVFPPGLQVGKIAGGPEGEIRVTPIVALERLEFIRLIDSITKKRADFKIIERSPPTRAPSK